MVSPFRFARTTLVLLVVAFLAAACGARVSEEQVQAVQGGRNGGAGGVALGGGDAGVATNGDATAAEGGTGASSGGEPSATGTADPGATAGAAEGTTAAPAGGNGGATDVGVSATEIVLGNVSTLSGPVPGLFAGAVYGTQAAVAYQNSKGGIFGRKLRLEVRDDQFDTGQYKAQTTELASKVFAFVGSFSLYDDAAVDVIEKNAIPDFGIPINDSRGRLPTNFSTSPIDPAGGPTGGFEYVQGKFPDAVKAVGSIYGDVPASKQQHQRMQRVAEALGWKFVYTRGYQPTETDFTADVVRMRQSGVKAIFTFAADDKANARLANAMKQQGFEPEFVLTSYAPSVVELAKDAVEGWYGNSTYVPFLDPDEPGRTPEVKLMLEWLHKVKPGYKADLYIVYTWSMARLAFQAMEQAGPKLTRAGVADAVRKIGQFDAHGLMSPSNPGAKTPPVCFVITQVKGGQFRRIDPASGYSCKARYLRT
jgi:ABC-type branched-subunit amino acid transport system substrate-binding protein